MKKKSILLGVILILIFITLLLTRVFTSNRYAFICGLGIPILVAIGVIIYSKPKKLNS